MQLSQSDFAQSVLHAMRAEHGDDVPCVWAPAASWTDQSE